MIRRHLDLSRAAGEHRAKLSELHAQTDALKQASGNDAKAKAFLEGMAKFSPPTSQVASPMRSGSYDLGWRDIDRPKDIEWYGPDKIGGNCGAKLVSQAEGDFTAYCGVGVFVPQNGQSHHNSSINWTTLLGFCDAGGFYTASSSRTEIKLSVDIHDANGEREYTAGQPLFVNGATNSGGGAYYESHSYSDSGSLSLTWDGDPNALFSIWASVILKVQTWGPAGAQANLHVIFDDISPG